MKGNKGITLIALIVTIIVLIILAGVAIAMIAGDNGIINNASKAKIDTQIATVDEKVKLARTSMAANIISRSNQASADEYGYVATRQTAFKTLVNELRQELGLDKKDDGKDTTISRDGFTVTYFDPTGTTGLLADDAEIDENEREAYILITYTDNSLRSSLPKKNEVTGTTYTSAGVKFNVVGNYNPNTTVLAYVIKVTDYGCELCVPSLASTSSTSGKKLTAENMSTSVVKDDYAKTSFDETETPTGEAPTTT